MYSSSNNQTAPLNKSLKRNSVKKSKPSTSGQNHFENENIEAGLKTCKKSKISPNCVPNRVSRRLSSRNLKKCSSYKPSTEAKDNKTVTSSKKNRRTSTKALNSSLSESRSKKKIKTENFMPTVTSEDKTENQANDLHGESSVLNNASCSLPRKMLRSKQTRKTSKPCVSKGRNPKKAANSSLSLSTDVVEAEVQAGEPHLRRSKRDKIPPLESWRNECRLFRCVAGQIEAIGIHKGTPADTSAVDRVLKRMSKAQESKSQPKKKSKLMYNASNSKHVPNDIKQVATINPSTGEEEFMYLHRPYSTLLWSIPPSQNKSDPSYTITKCITSEHISFGYIEIGVSKKKEEQYSPVDNITFNVIKGKVRMCINKENFNLKELDTMLVPASNIYSIHNIGKMDAVLSFCIFKTPLFDYQSTKDSH